ncbi:PREDICTED: GEM-like protein 7 [Ipomoea nil]|uniref:GEM-like protein 7 n=1 Tax=Ipomoea nil TaxID=35883 RepID=UPI000900AFC5|nr:PREDICTED: GEM-like protein 7 [Ipomoea nil]
MNPLLDVRIPICSAVSSFGKSQKRLLACHGPQCHALALSNEPSKIRFSSRADSVAHKMNKFAQGIREHVKLGDKITETVKGKLSLGKKILQVGGVSKIFKWNFNVKEGEELLKTSQCYLSTTSGPIAGLLFISTDKIAFCSERSIKLSSSSSSSSGKSLRVRYKVMIPLRKIKSANESRNEKKPSQKYIQVVTEDKHEFWFMGFLNHQRTLKHFKEAIYQTQC